MSKLPYIIQRIFSTTIHCPSSNILYSASAFLLFFLSLSLLTTHAQPYPADYFRSPMDFRLLLSGTFGELRANHLHSGIDIKTNGSTGARVYAVADGYVSRINVSAYGFGKALYINHPNGYTSVYAHLDYFAQPIHGYVINEHYSRESFEMTLYPMAGELPVKKGDIIAYSGNSGSSGGPHLHFEIRKEATQEPINPLLFGFEVKDFYRPRITWLKIYAADSNSRINGQPKDIKLQVEGWGLEHRLISSRPLLVSGQIGFGIQCHDQQNDTQNKNGPYSVKVYVDEHLISSTRMESFAFSETRYINSLIDYDEYQRSKMKIQRSEVDPGNELRIYDVRDNDGKAFIDDKAMHRVKIEVTDLPGNTSVLEFDLQGDTAVKGEPSDEPGEGYFHPMRSNRFESDGFILEASAGTFYRSFRFRHEKSSPLKGSYAEVHHIHDKYTPVHKYIEIAIKPQWLPERWRKKALLVRIPDGDQSFVSAGGSYENDGFVHGKIREFGKYTVTADTLAPVITALNSTYHKNLAGQVSVRFKIKDELSGIKSYRGTLNGQWILMDYDAKNDLLVYFIEDHLKKGANTFRLEVTDNKDNVKIYETSLVR